MRVSHYRAAHSMAETVDFVPWYYKDSDPSPIDAKTRQSGPLFNTNLPGDRRRSRKSSLPRSQACVECQSRAFWVFSLEIGLSALIRRAKNSTIPFASSTDALCTGMLRPLSITSMFSFIATPCSTAARYVTIAVPFSSSRPSRTAASS